MKTICLAFAVIWLSVVFSPAQTNGPGKPVGSGIHLRDTKLQEVLEVYAQIKGRTLLLHPALKSDSISLDAEPQAAGAAFDEMFRQHGIATIPDGDKFMMVVPMALTNTVAARSSEVVARLAEDASVKSAVILQAGGINLRGTDVPQVLLIYEKLIGRTLIRTDWRPGGAIHLRTVTPLTHAEAIYALQTLLYWNGVQIIFVESNSFKVVPVVRN